MWGGAILWQESMAWAWNKTVDYVLVEAWSGLRVYMHFIWVPSSLISGGSREGRGLVLASTLRAPPPPPQWCRQTQRRECALLLLCCLHSGAGSVFRVAEAYLNVWILVSPSMVGCPHCFPLVSEKSLGWEDWLLGEFPGATPRSALLEHPFGTKRVGRAVPPLDSLRNALSVSWWRGCWNLRGKHIPFQTFLLQPLDCNPSFFKAPNSIWHLVFLKWNQTWGMWDGREMAKERSKAIFSFHILLDKRIWVNINMLKPKSYVRALCKMRGKLQLWKQ